jgi:hypothetical protein
MEQLLHDLLSPAVSWVIVVLTLFVLGWHTLGAYRGFRGEIRSLFAWTQAQKLAGLRKRRARLIRLQESDREYYGWLLSGVLSVLALFALALLYEVVLAPPTGSGPQADIVAHFLLSTVRFGLGWAAYWIAIGRWKDYRWLQRFDRAMTRLDRAIAILETKTSVQPTSAGV